MAKPKQFTRPPKKQKAKAAAPQSADDFQEAADLEEETGGKWRAGDSAKSGRAFVRALDLYDQGIARYPSNFDLAYNKARLQLEITQQPAIVAHIGLPIVDLLQQTLLSHRFALRLNDTNPDALFNTAQVLITLAEHLSEADDSSSAIANLHEALELLSSCLSRQEMLLEQHLADLEDLDEGGVALDDATDDTAVEPDSSASEQEATVETPVSPTDLLDTVQASLSALTTLVSLVEAGNLQTLGDMALSLSETKAPAYIAQLPDENKVHARASILLDRARFIAALADSQYSAGAITLNDYLARLQEYSIVEKDHVTGAMLSEGEARLELSLSVLARYDQSSELPIEVCWKQLSLAQDLLSKAAKAESDAQTYLLRGDVELLRHRLAAMQSPQLADNLRKSAPILAQNAQTYYRGAVKLAGLEDEGIASKAQTRLEIVLLLRETLYNIDSPRPAASKMSTLQHALASCVEDGLLDGNHAETIYARSMSS